MISVQQGQFHFSTASIKSFSRFLSVVCFALFHPMINDGEVLLLTPFFEFARMCLVLTIPMGTCSIRPYRMHKRICDANHTLSSICDQHFIIIWNLSNAVHRLQCRLLVIPIVEHHMHVCQLQVWSSFSCFSSIFDMGTIELRIKTVCKRIHLQVNF